MEDLSVTVWICLLLFRFQDVRTASEFHPHDITDMAWGIATAGRRWVPEEDEGWWVPEAGARGGRRKGAGVQR